MNNSALRGPVLPFKPGLIPHDTLTESYCYPDRDRDEIIRYFPVIGDTDAETYVENVVSLFKELGKFGIEVAPFSPVVTDVSSFVFVVENIGGQAIDVDELSGTDSTVASELESQLFKYLEYKIDSGAPFLADIFSLHQYMFIPGGQPVLVDLEPNIVASRHENPENPGIRAMFELNSLLSLLTDSGRMYCGRADQIDTWRQKAHWLLSRIADKNGIIIDKEHEQSFINSALIDANYDVAAEPIDNSCFGKD